MVIVKIYSFSFANRQIFDIILYLLLIRHAEACHLLSQEKADIVQVLERWQISHLPDKQEFTVHKKVTVCAVNADRYFIDKNVFLWYNVL